MKRDDSQLDRLLARGRLSRPETARMLAAALPALPRRRRRWLWASAAAPALAAAGLVLMMWPRGDPFRAKGRAGGPSVTASCPRPAASAGCAVGRTLIYRVDGAREALYLAAWTVDGSGTRTWHFPSASGELPKVNGAAAAGAPFVIPRGVRLGSAGPQTLHWALLKRPLEREAILAGDAMNVAARGELPLLVAP